jgi:teichoic acid transport system permease protein
MAVADVNNGQLSAPGAFETGVVIVAEAPNVPDGSLSQYAIEHGLIPSGTRPSLRRYLKAIWQRRHFIIGYATARNVSMYTEAKLGQIWQVLTPLLNACVYYLIFGFIFQQSRGVEHYIAFLVCGVFIFAFTERSIVTNANVMRVNLPLIRALYFPRAALPLAYVIVELEQTMLSLIVLFAIVLGFGEPLTLYWFLMVPVMLLQTVFNVGAALLVARLAGAVQDVGELIPFILRISRYFCGVMYMVTTLEPVYTRPWLERVLMLNPVAVFISLARVSLMKSYRTNSPGNAPYNAAICNAFHNDDGGSHLVSGGTHLVNGVEVPGQYVSNAVWQASCHAVVTNPQLWIAAVGWAVVTFFVGLLFFWSAEHRYGRG